MTLLSKAISPFKVAWGRTPVVWKWTRSGDQVDEILRIYARNYFPGWAAPRFHVLRNIMYFYMLAIWPVRACLIIISNTGKYHLRARQESGRGIFGQVGDQLKIAFYHSHNPEVYYTFKLFSSEQISLCRSYFLENHMTALFAVVNRSKDDSLIEDKLLFNRAVTSKGYRAASDIACLNSKSAGKPRELERVLPRKEFIVKPRNSLSGKNVYCVRFLDGEYQFSNGEAYSPERMREFLLQLCMEDDVLLQDRLINHDGILDLTSGGFGTSRIVTGLCRVSGKAEVVTAVFKMPVGDSIVDNFNSGGIAAPIDVESGRLGQACAKEAMSATHRVHPDTGALIEGRALPCWQETVAAVVSLHQELASEFPFLGWDVGVTNEGPVLLESQVTLGFFLVEKPGSRALGLSRFPEIYLEWSAGLE